MRTFLRAVGLAVLVCGGGPDSRWGARAVRIDRSTGTTWMLRARHWMKVDEPD